MSQRWALGVTTCPKRFETLLPRTLLSLETAGWFHPHLFVDGEHDSSSWRKFGGGLTCRHPAVGVAGNWILSMQEMLVRCPDAHRYALFQDDLVCVRGLREYLERVEYRPFTYWNLYTFPQNDALREAGRKGFYDSNQLGLGAVALVFNRAAVLALLGQENYRLKPLAADRRDCNIDGCIVEAMKQAGWKEQVHFPSLVQHTGLESSFSWHVHPQAATFPGEDFSALSLL